ncbi:MAG: phosphate-starvation-inducible PsiE family protein [Flavobacteriales bacterium]|jgi:uncharacterized membrane protein (DUF373 family)
MDKIIHKSEKILYAILALLIIAFVTYEILDLIYLFYCEVSQFSILENKSIALTGVPLFFNIIIALEILETFKGANENILRKVKIIVLIALTAISRKIITMDIKHSEYHLLFGISILIIALCAGYYLLNKKENSDD